MSEMLDWGEFIGVKGLNRENPCYATVQIQKKQVENVDGDKIIKIEGIAYYYDENDRDQELIIGDAFSKAIPGYMLNPIILFCHDQRRPIGKVLSAEPQQRGLFYSGVIYGKYDAEIVYKMEHDIIKATSVGFWPVKWEKMMDGVIKFIEIDWLETSVVTIPSSRRALFSVSKAARMGTDIVIPDYPKSSKIYELPAVIMEFPGFEAAIKSATVVLNEATKHTIDEKALVQAEALLYSLSSITKISTKGAVRSHETPMAVEDRPWDKVAADKRVRKWASKDGSGDKEKMDFAKYRSLHGWYNADDWDNFGAYKLLHHDIIDGEPKVVWKGVAAAMGALMGARAELQIPDSDRRGVYNHLAKHYEQFKKEMPEFKEADVIIDTDAQKKYEEALMTALQHEKNYGVLMSAYTDLQKKNSELEQQKRLLNGLVVELDKKLANR